MASDATPLFDANAHPSLSGEVSKRPASFSLLQQQLNEAGFVGACAVALPDDVGYNHKDYFLACQAHPNFIPVAGWNNVPAAKIEQTIFELKEYGYRAIKVHPRRCGLSVRDSRFARMLRICASAEMVVLHCTYQFGTDGSLHPIDPLPALLDAIASAAGIRMVLVHGGTVELLRYSEVVRGNPNLLLDLSFTLNRYRGSSLDLDLAYLFNTLDQRICIGSDFPEYSPSQVRSRFEKLTSTLPTAKRDNIGWKNIMGLMRPGGSH